MHKTLVVKTQNQITSVHLNRPEVHNAFNPQMIRELTEVFKNKDLIEQSRVFHLSGEGKSFCAGADLNWMKESANYTERDNIQDAEKLFSLFETLFQNPLPIIGRVHGKVFGGGLGLTALCDVSVADADSEFCFSEVLLGLAPSVITPFALNKMNFDKLKELMLTAKRFTAQEAKVSGLVQFVGVEDEILKYVEESTCRILSASKEAITKTKELLNSFRQDSIAQKKGKVVKLISHLRVGKEAQSRLSDFLNKIEK